MSTIPKTIQEKIDDILDDYYHCDTYTRVTAVETICELFSSYQLATGGRECWQLCPKCNGDGHLGRYNAPPFASTTITPVCDVCNGAKIFASPNFQSSLKEKDEEISALKGEWKERTELIKQLREFISAHEKGLLPNEFIYEDAKMTLNSMGE